MSKVVTYTLQTLVIGDCTELRVFKNAAGSWVQQLTAGVKDETGKVIYVANYTAPLTSGQITTIANFITGQDLPALNTQEGL